MVITTQGVYYVLTGLWPLLSMATFEAVTGPKTDDWLVHTVAALVLAVGSALLVGCRRKAPSLESLALAGSAAVAFAAIDIVYVANGTISDIYLADAAVEGVFLVALAVASVRLGRA